nr:hypothetical protein [Tanacetum cinerariifolium]
MLRSTFPATPSGHPRHPTPHPTMDLHHLYLPVAATITTAILVAITITYAPPHHLPPRHRLHLIIITLLLSHQYIHQHHRDSSSPPSRHHCHHRKGSLVLFITAKGVFIHIGYNTEKGALGVVHRFGFVWFVHAKARKGCVWVCSFALRVRLVVQLQHKGAFGLTKLPKRVFGLADCSKGCVWFSRNALRVRVAFGIAGNCKCVFRLTD